MVYLHPLMLRHFVACGEYSRANSCFNSFLFFIYFFNSLFLIIQAMYINDFKPNIFSLLNWSISIFLPTFSLVNSSSSFDFILILPFIFPTILIIVVDRQWLILPLLISIVITKVCFRLLEFDWLIRLFINNVSNYNHNFVIFIINTLLCYNALFIST